jgi:hypothetical protein
MNEFERYKARQEKSLERYLTGVDGHKGMKTKLATQRKAKVVIKMIYQYQMAMLNPNADADSMAWLRSEHLKLQGQLEALNWVLGPGRIEP